MDLAPLFAATLSSDANERVRAELSLKQLENQDGLLTNVLHLVSNAEVNLGIRQAASIYLKNRIARAWPLDSEDRHAKGPQALPAHFQDRQTIRDSIVPALTVAAPILKKQLSAALGTVIQNDFPEVTRCSLTAVWVWLKLKVTHPVLARLARYHPARSQFFQ